MQIVVGQSALSGDFSSYVQRFGALEVAIESESVPKRSRLERWREQAPENFVFSVELAAAKCELHQRAPVAADVDAVLLAVATLKAQWLIVRTPPQVRPDSRVKQRLATLVGLLSTEHCTIGWEPSGLWEPRAAAKLATELGVVLVSDLTREDAPVGSLLYTRVRRRGRAIGPNQLLPLLERALPAERCVVIVEGNADPVQRWLRQELQFLDDSAEASA